MKNVTKSVSAVLVIGLVGSLGISKTSGSPGGYSSAPGESDCTSCHDTFSLDSGPNLLSIGAAPASVGLASVPVQVSFATPGPDKFGFEISARDNFGAKVTAWEITDSTHTKTTSGNVTQTSAGAQLSSWTMAWNPPAGLPPGPVTFYVAGLEGNGGGTSGDYVYTSEALLYQAEISTPLSTWPLGTMQPLALAAPTRGGDSYIIALSDSTTPTTLPGGLVIPVDLGSPLFSVGITTPAFFQGFFGTLDGAGNAAAQVVIPSLPILSGFELHFAFAAVAPGGGIETEVSNRVSVILQ